MIICNKKQVYDHIHLINQNIQKSLQKIQASLQMENPFLQLKFGKTAFDPITGEPINFIEMLNQAYSDLVVFQAVAELLDIFPEKEFSLNIGATSGYDIESIDGEIIAECFAVVSVNSNQKLDKDAKKLMLNVVAKERYIFFYAHSDSDSMIEAKRRKYPEIEIKRIYDLSGK